MSFTSLEFFLFAAAVILAYALVRRRQRWIMLLLASVAFYASLNAPYLLVALGAVTLVSYAAGRWMGQASPRRRKTLLVASTLLNLAIMLIFRYLSDLVLLFNGPGAAAGGLPVLISIVVSFYVFQGISYTVDVYLETIEPELHPGYFALYMAFFSKILQGPIERGGDLLPQLRGELTFEEAAASAGLRRFGWGLFKKVVIADRLALLVNPVFSDVHSYSGLALILAVYLYAFELYFDFSGYTDMALGLARLFNIRLTENFNQPYLAHTVAEFWRRWHMSFSRWILDYLFKPLQISWRRWGAWGVVGALMVAFLASGLWHGITWGFATWGLLYGVYLSVEWAYAPWRKKLYRRLHLTNSRLVLAWQVFLTFHLVCFAWIFFRANTFSDALYVASNLFNGVHVASCAKVIAKYWAYLPVTRGVFDLSGFSTAAGQVCTNTLHNFPSFQGQFAVENAGVLLVSVLLLAAGGWVSKRLPLTQWPVVIRWAGYFTFTAWVLFGLGILETPGGSFSQFLYFKF